MTIRKVKTILPSLKPQTEMLLKSSLVYQINCPRCQSCYVGQTSRHLKTRFKEHQRLGTPVELHFRMCDVVCCVDDVKILATTNKSIITLMTLEALFIKSINPTINTKDEYKSRVLTIKI